MSHDRWLVGQLATRVVEIKSDDILDYQGTYEEYVHFCGDDHLDANQVILKARKEKSKKDRRASDRATRSNGKSKQRMERERKQAQERQNELMTRIETAESRIAEIDAIFCDQTYYERTPSEAVRELEAERSYCEYELNTLMEEWEKTVESAEKDLG